MMILKKLKLNDCVVDKQLETEAGKARKFERSRQASEVES